MLHVSQITTCQAGSDEWLLLRLGKLTSSEIHNIMSVKGLSAGSMSYLRKKAGELITSQTDEKEYGFIESFAWGIKNEINAVKEIALINDWPLVVTQKAVIAGDGSVSTPDCIVIKDQIDDGYIVETVEVKCPQTYSEHLLHRDCDTAEKLKKSSEKYYWQVIDQMLVCGATVGHFFSYHEKFPIGNRGHQITFKKVPLWEDFKALAERKKEAHEVLKSMVIKYTKK